jgi:hypothetical protein
MTTSTKAQSSSVLAAAGIDERDLLYAERQLVKQGKLAAVAHLQQKRFKKALVVNAVFAVLYLVKAFVVSSVDPEPLREFGLQSLFGFFFVFLAVVAGYQYGRMTVARELLAEFEKSTDSGGAAE